MDYLMDPGRKNATRAASAPTNVTPPLQVSMHLDNRPCMAQLAGLARLAKPAFGTRLTQASASIADQDAMWMRAPHCCHPNHSTLTRACNPAVLLLLFLQVLGITGPDHTAGAVSSQGHSTSFEDPKSKPTS